MRKLLVFKQLNVTVTISGRNKYDLAVYKDQQLLRILVHPSLGISQ